MAPAWKYVLPLTLVLAASPGCDGLTHRIRELARDIKGAVVLHSLTPEQLRQNDELEERASTYANDTGKCAIVVYKVPRKMSVFCGGREEMFDVELGKEPYGDKEKEGDLKTPEGEYGIKEISERPEAKFSHAFYLDYPRPQDEKEFEDAKRAGLLDANDTIGGGVQIHGGGGRGYDFTAGCIGLKNSDLERLMDHARQGKITVGTPVVIVTATSESL